MFLVNFYHHRLLSLFFLFVVYILMGFKKIFHWQNETRDEEAWEKQKNKGCSQNQCHYLIIGVEDAVGFVAPRVLFDGIVYFSTYSLAIVPLWSTFLTPFLSITYPLSDLIWFRRHLQHHSNARKKFARCFPAIRRTRSSIAPLQPNKHKYS